LQAAFAREIANLPSRSRGTFYIHRPRVQIDTFYYMLMKVKIAAAAAAVERESPLSPWSSSFGVSGLSV